MWAAFGLWAAVGMWAAVGLWAWPSVSVPLAELGLWAELAVCGSRLVSGSWLVGRLLLMGMPSVSNGSRWSDIVVNLFNLPVVTPHWGE